MTQLTPDLFDLSLGVSDADDQDDPISYIREHLRSRLIPGGVTDEWTKLLLRKSDEYPDQLVHFAAMAYQSDQVQIPPITKKKTSRAGSPGSVVSGSALFFHVV